MLIGLIMVAIGFQGESVLAQQTTCATPVGEDLITPRMLEEARNLRGGTYTVEIWVHSINEDDGTGGPTYQEVIDELKDLEDYFAPHNICFAFMGYDKINDSSYASDSDFTGTDATNLIAAYPPNTSVLDMYILPDYTFYRGSAFAIPNHYLLIYAGRFNTAHLSHETGHCLGLYHTHETAFGVECPDGSNGSTAGDKCSDTPADDDGGWSSSPCSYDGGGTNCGQAINADPDNIMSYAPYSCRDQFTADQRARMYSNLASSATLAPLLVTSATASLSGSYQSGESFWSRTETITCLSGYDAGSSAYVTLNAGNYIELQAGVDITPNSSGHFLATINQCDFNLLRLADYEHDEEPVQITDDSEFDMNVYPNPFKD
ncbi:MAG: M43 family zinc metalloprotease, partial [Flavobacteriales bacterium]|nr:M43 family zinc metalloprotease [Flavobacteriales bacterium]